MEAKLRGTQMKVGVIHQVLAYSAAAVAAVSVILAGVCRLVAHPVGFQLTSYMIIAVVAMLFAIYFFAGGIFFSNTQVRSPLAAWQSKKQKVGPSPETKMLKQERVFSISGNNKGLRCPFRAISCQNGYCEECQIYTDWQKLGEILVVCALCSNEITRKSGGLGQSAVSLGICPECWQGYVAKRWGSE